ncbi:MAG TPA: hypothetical protein VKE97_08330, partial [Acidimicrobiia bacterium]|nr:hypothetical protein [Acidimicrobiia bacterium]
MSWAEETSPRRGFRADPDWPSADGEEPRSADGRTQGDDESSARGFFLGQPADPATEEIHTAGAVRRTPAELDGVLRDGALRFESLVGNCQAELQDTVAAHVSDLEQTFAAGTEEMNRAAAQRITDLEEAVD